MRTPKRLWSWGRWCARLRLPAGSSASAGVQALSDKEGT
jgi:hypothetical protein